MRPSPLTALIGAALLLACGAADAPAAVPSPDAPALVDTALDAPFTTDVPFTSDGDFTFAGEGVYGPGTPTFYADEAGNTLVSVQAWQYSGGASNPCNRGQIMRTYRVAVNDAWRPRATLVRVDL